jgi:hypothetical protein
VPPEYFFPLLGAVFALGWGLLGTIRWYIKEQVKLRRQAAPDAADLERVAALESRVQELEERLDFAERVLAQGRNDRLPAGGRPEA